MTHKSTLGASRLDRIYANPHAAGNFTGDWQCRALEWAEHLSTHRPVEVQYKVKGEDREKGRSLPGGPARRKDWSVRVELRWGSFSNPVKTGITV